MRIPGVPAIFAPSMAAYLGPTQGRIFHDITEATNEMVKRTLTRFSTHAWKSLASTSGGNFETFSVAVMNPYLPMDLNNAGVMLGLGVNPTQPISKKNPPDEKTQAFMLTGGDYYTVNMKIPLKIQEEWPDAKGADAQADYVRVIPPTNPRGNYKVKIIEFKNGLTHLEMADEEAAQMMKETAAITEWYKSLGKNVEIERFYCPAAATDARAYGSTHISPYVHFITVSGLSKIIQVPLAQMRNFTRYRTTYTQALTQKLAEIERRTLKFLEETDKELVLNRLRQITPKNLGLNNNNENLASGRNYPQRRLTVVKYMIIRSTLLRKLKGTVSAEEEKQLSRKLRHVTQLILEANKPFNVSEQVLTNKARSNLITSLGGRGSKTPEIPDTSFEDLVLERREYLKETYPNLPEWPSNFEASEIIKPIIFSKNEEAINSRLATLSRKKTITHENINAVIRTTQGRVANRLSNHFKMYFQSKINKFRTIANTNKVQVNTSKKRAISNLVYNSNSNTENNEVVSTSKKVELSTNVLNSIINSENFEAQYSEFLKAHGANAGRAINNRIIQLRNLNKNKAYTLYYNAINEAKKRVNSKI